MTRELPAAETSVTLSDLTGHDTDTDSVAVRAAWASHIVRSS